jgi:hypothetical protein
MKDPKRALEFAARIAKFLINGGRQIGLCATGDLLKGKHGLMTALSVMSASCSQDVGALNPHFLEVILFGSAAEDGKIPNDVDLMVIDEGFYSNILAYNGRTSLYRRGGAAEANLIRLASGWFGLDENEPEMREVLDETNVDVVVLPVSVFTDVSRRCEISRRQPDPDFFDNAFRHMMRFDEDSGQFVRVDLAYFEEKYAIDPIP